MSVVEKQQYTYADYLAVTDEGLYQLINEDLVMSPSPSFLHQHIVTELSFLMSTFLHQQPERALLIVAPMDVYLTEDEVYQLRARLPRLGW